MLCIDLSNNNGEPNFHALRQAGVAGVWLKASEGDFFVDHTFAERRKAANAAGLRVGAYAFGRPDRCDPKRDAQTFAAVVETIGRKDLRPVLDYERTTGHGNDEEWIRTWNHTVKTKLGTGPLFYSYPGLLSQLGLRSTVGYGLWLAAYGPNDGKEHDVAVPAPWKKLVAHQFTSVGHVAGYGPVDISSVKNVNAVLAHPVIGRGF